jgi:hypothetical protein
MLCLIPGLSHKAYAQVNDDKILREASGTYKGTRAGGSATFSGGDPALYAPFTMTPPTVKAKFKLPVSSRKPKIKIKAPGELPGSGTAVYKGKRKKAKVSPNGNKISYKVVRGVGREDDNQPDYTGGTVKGNIKKKGTKWATKLKMSAVQQNRQDLWPTLTAKGLKVKAKQ